MRRLLIGALAAAFTLGFALTLASALLHGFDRAAHVLAVQP